MLAALGGFAIIWSIVALGALLAHTGVLGASAEATLNKLTFAAASPALLFTIVAKGSLGHLVSPTLLASVVAIAAAIGVYLLVNALWLRHGLDAGTIGWLSAAYTNAGNLGLPIALHVLGDMTWMAPILLLQVGLLQPFALACLDASAARADGVRLSPARYALLPLRNPITVGILAGLLVNLTQPPLPSWLLDAVAMVGATAVPLMLIAFGISLRLDPLPGRGAHAGEVWAIQAIKLIVMPAVAWGVGRLLGLPPAGLMAVTVIAALPSAQNIFVIASRYRVALPVARDALFWSTILTVPVITAISAWLS
ncbi:AEC family transporter [Propioniciclava tarda]|uniref:AEC family transporter n=1 Tax=Propioniciclava tarda TaxID=433330 RepID=A0A4Q9KN95_PROTD|nr:AEC family transporter [Propioniciclava tarda]TBT96028.1 AEC family transporter [Propioniciclava tarda]SMO43222.1 hypothetical protein SAMN06266982_102315 [Propioniciclava tarda]